MERRNSISAVYSNFGKNTVEQQWLVWLLLLQKTAVFSEIEQSDRIRSDMASGAVIVRSIDKFPHRDFSLNFIHDIERVFVGIGMCNSDDLFFRFYNIVTDERDELV